jgi:hypothetical protein
MLSVRELRVQGRHGDLVAPTSFEAPIGALTLVQADGQDTRTALALAASGRYFPDGGTALWGAEAGPKKNLKTLRRASALVDSPGINEAERHLSVLGLVGEDLSLLPRRHRAFGTPEAWLTVHAFEDVASQWVDELPARRRVELLTDLALSDPAVRLLVVDSPDRHSERAEDWLPRLERLATEQGRPLAVVAIVGEVPLGWEAGTAVVGNSQTQPLEEVRA